MTLPEEIRFDLQRKKWTRRLAATQITVVAGFACDRRVVAHRANGYTLVANVNPDDFHGPSYRRQSTAGRDVRCLMRGFDLRVFDGEWASRGCEPDCGASAADGLVVVEQLFEHCRFGGRHGAGQGHGYERHDEGWLSVHKHR